MSLPVLYSFRRCPYAMRARMAIILSGEQVELRDILLRDKPQEMLTASPKGTVPVLVLQDGTVIDESLDIMRWALGKNDPHNLLEHLDASLTLIATNDGPFKKALDRYKYPSRYPDEPPHNWQTEGLRFIEELAARLDSQPYLLGPEPRLADYAIFPFIRQFRMPDEAWFDALPHPALHKWLGTLTNSPPFTTAMAKIPTWQSGTPGPLWP
ncbi:MAG: glutathione S-transferase [Proteobacteria bacterium]|nr:glutathione S-transferase [Pseudomonadota bacterium]